MKLNRLLSIVLSIGLFGSMVGCSDSSNTKEKSTDSENTVVTIGYLPITHALAVFEEKELLEQENSNITIKLEKFSAWSDLTDALNTGRIDGASILIELAMSAKSQGIDLKAVALGHKDGNVVVVSNDIQSVADLKGKTFAIPHTQSSHNILLNDMLSNEGLTIDDINITQLSPSEMPSSLASGAISGYCVAEPFGAQAVSQGIGKVLYYSEDLWENSLCCGLIFNGTYLENNQDTINIIIDKYNEAGSKLDNETAKSVASEYLGQTDDVLDVSLQWINYDDLTISQDDYNLLCDKVISYGILENPPTYEEFVYEKD
ncbi:MAG: ABC transporter substrate-binding protein [Oscillospiraceae bacterium]